MRRILPLTILLLILFLIGLGVYALIAGRMPLIRGELHGPPARIVGLLLIVFTILAIPVLLRALVGMTLNLGH
jgi:hypothetical protein